MLGYAGVTDEYLDHADAVAPPRKDWFTFNEFLDGRVFILQGMPYWAEIKRLIEVDCDDWETATGERRRYLTKPERLALQVWRWEGDPETTDNHPDSGKRRADSEPSCTESRRCDARRVSASRP